MDQSGFIVECVIFICFIIIILIVLFFLYRKRKERLEREDIVKKFEEKEDIMEHWQKHTRYNKTYHKAAILSQGHFEYSKRAYSAAMHMPEPEYDSD